jgi:endonuclease YncB( thermonuclease family)
MKAAQQSFREAMDNIPPSLKDGDLMKEFVEGINKIKNPKAHKRGEKFIDLIKGLVEYSSGKRWDDLSWAWRFGHYIKIMGLPCFVLFIIEETYQVAGFTTMASREMAKGFMGQTMAQRQDVIDNYQGVVNWQKLIFAAALPVNAIASILCWFMSPAYVLYTISFHKNVEQNQWHVDQLQLGMDVTTGFGNVKLPIRANMHGVQIMVDMMTQNALAGPYVTQYPTLLREDTQQYSIKGWKKGYIQKDPVFITATAANIIPYGEPLSEVEVILIPESQLMTDKPIDIPTGTGYQGINYDDIPVCWGGNCPDDEWWGGYGDINCKTTGGGAEIWLISAAGVRKYAGKTNAIVESIPVGDYIVEFIKEGWRCTDCPNCRVPVHVGVTPVNAWCTMAEITAFEPVAKLIVKPSTYANTGEELSFGAEGSEPGTGASFKSFVFDFGDGTLSATITSLAIPEPQKHAYTEAGDYTAKLTITNSDGLIGEDFVYVTISEAMGIVSFSRDVNDKLKDFAPEIWYKKEGEANWQVHTQEGPTGSYHSKVEWPLGRYEIEYRYLGITRCGKSVEVLADKETPFSCPLILYLPDQHVVEGVNDVRTTVTAVKDGDTIYTAFTDSLPPRPGGSQRVRMVGYDAPDMAILDTYATELLKELLPVGTPITLKIVSYNVLGRISRVLAGVIKDDGTDVNRKMIESCLVSEPEKTAYTKDLYFNWELEFSNYWGDPTSDRCLASTDPAGKAYISMIVNTANGTVQINNRWLPVYAVIRKYKGAMHVGSIDDYAGRTIATKETSSSYSYGDAEVVKLFVSSKEITAKNPGFEIESIIIGEAPPDTYAVTFTSSPAGANVIVTSGTLSISRLTSVLKKQRDSTPISRLFRRERFK